MDKANHMPFDPKDAIAEVLGQRALGAINPSKNGFLCPYLDSKCPKRSTNVGDEPYPVCSLWKGVNKIGRREPATELICVCPKRFHQIDWLRAVIDNCWPFDPPTNPVVASEVKMKGFGNIDFVIADQNTSGEIGNFLSVELQAIDITGSVYPAYDALRSNDVLPKRPTYGFNWDNVYKRYITQLIRKGYYHHHWGTKIVAVIQDQVYQTVIDRADFMRSKEINNNNVNIIFMTYVFDNDPDNPGEFCPVLRRVEGTSHANLQQAILYKGAPSKDAFKGSISEALLR